MRFHAPSRATLDRGVFLREPLRDWCTDFPELLAASAWPSIEVFERARIAVSAIDGTARPHFVAQTPDLIADGMHYEQRIADGRIATRAENWHDLLNALVWLRYPRIKHALNARQVADIARVGPRQRTRAQCALTHFDEGGVIVLCSDPALVASWDAHDWLDLFGAQAQAWGTRIAVLVFGHAILEHALQPGQLLVGKAVAMAVEPAMLDEVSAGDTATRRMIDARVADAIARGELLVDPQDLRALPLCGIAAWDERAREAEFLAEAPCFRPLRDGRTYPRPLAF